jgi:hypothetical protein
MKAKFEYAVSVYVRGDLGTRFNYSLCAYSPGNAVERILLHMGWLRDGVAFVTYVKQLH